MGAKETFFPPQNNPANKGPVAANPQPTIVSSHSCLIPVQTAMGQGAAVALYGLSLDSKMYQWFGDIKAWVLA